MQSKTRPVLATAITSTPAAAVGHFPASPEVAFVTGQLRRERRPRYLLAPPVAAYGGVAVFSPACEGGG